MLCHVSTSPHLLIVLTPFHHVKPFTIMFQYSLSLMSSSFHPLSHRVRLSAKCKRFKQNSFPLTITRQAGRNRSSITKLCCLKQILKQAVTCLMSIRGFRNLSIFLLNSCVYYVCAYNKHPVNTQAVNSLCFHKHNDSALKHRCASLLIIGTCHTVCFRQTLFLVPNYRPNNGKI